MKYMILSYGTQQDYDEMGGKDTGRPAWTAEEMTAMGEFMAAFSQELTESGELVETRALAAPVLTRRVAPDLRGGLPVVTDGPYAETQEVLAGYWVVDVDGFDRATEIAARLNDVPAPAHIRAGAYADVRPLMDERAELLEP
ncbi:YciI family protein [Catenuloplanes sp. NPDC051500]|uniref:YciI family protein n=1 Tax=Catenuloplanes sp. NPDC051500 TaxID=3363959 RepID=UPI0037A366AF